MQRVAAAPYAVPFEDHPILIQVHNSGSTCRPDPAHHCATLTQWLGSDPTRIIPTTDEYALGRKVLLYTAPRRR